jgi:hypothetical protein
MSPLLLRSSKDSGKKLLYNPNFSTISLATFSIDWFALIEITFHSSFCFSAIGSVLFINSSILFRIDISLSSFLLINSSQDSGSNITQEGNVSHVLGLYILQSNLSIAFSFDNSKNTTL